MLRTDQLVIRQPTVNLRRKNLHALRVRHLASGEPEVELTEVPVQVLARDLVVRSIERPTKLGVVALHNVRPVRLVVRVLTLSLIHI